jgi:hypothetical protein
MTRSRITLLVALTSLALAGSTFDATAALARSPVHEPIVRTTRVPEPWLHARGSFVPHARATQPHDQDPFADLLLG